MAKSMYKLICSICAHPCTGVRCMTICENGSVITAGYENDKCAKLWIMRDNTCVGSVEMKGHDRNVTCVCSITKFPINLIITGSNDMHLCIYKFGESTPTRKLQAHKDRLCCVTGSVFDKLTFLTSSYDQLVKLWNVSQLDEPVAVLSGHTCTPLSVADLPNGLVVSSSSSFLLVHARDGQLLQKLAGHRLSVRDICAIGHDEFLSCDNDGTIKHWDLTSCNCVTDYREHQGYVHGVSALRGEDIVASCGADRTVRIWSGGVEEQTIYFPANSVKFVKIFKNQDIACGSSDGYVRIFSAHTTRYGDPHLHKKFVKEANSFDSSYEDNFEDDENNESLLQDTMVCMRMTVDPEDVPQVYMTVEINNNLVEKEEEDDDEVWTHSFAFQFGENPTPAYMTYSTNQNPVDVAEKFLNDHGLDLSNLELLVDKILNFKNIVAAQSTPLLPKTDYMELSTDFEALKTQIVHYNSAVIPRDRKVQKNELSAALSIAKNGTLQCGWLRGLTSLLKWPEPWVCVALDLVRVALLHKFANDKLCSPQFVLDISERFMNPEANLRTQLMALLALTNMFRHESGRDCGLYFKLELLEVMINMCNQPDANLLNVMAFFVLNLTVAMKEKADITSWERVLDKILLFIKIAESKQQLFNLVLAMGTLFPALKSTDQLQFAHSLFNCEEAMEMLKNVWSSTPKPSPDLSLYLIEKNLKRAVREFVAMTFGDKFCFE